MQLQKSILLLSVAGVLAAVGSCRAELKANDVSKGQDKSGASDSPNESVLQSPSPSPEAPPSSPSPGPEAPMETLPDPELSLLTFLGDGFLNAAEKSTALTLLNDYGIDSRWTQYRLIPVPSNEGCENIADATWDARPLNSLPTVSDLGGFADGAYKICGRFVGASGQSKFASTAVFTVDTAVFPGQHLPAENVLVSGFDVKWTPASDASSPVASLQYYVCSSSVSSNIDTVTECLGNGPGVVRIMDWSQNVLAVTESGKQLATGYFFNILVKDLAGNISDYGVTQKDTRRAVALPSPGHTKGRHVVFDTVNQRYWAFFVEGTSLKSSKSADGVSWSLATTLSGASIKNFTAQMREYGGIPYVFLASEENDWDIVIRRGRLWSDRIEFEAPVTVRNGLSDDFRFGSPAIATSATQIYLGYALFSAGRWSVSVIKGANGPLGDLSGWSLTGNLDGDGFAPRSLELVTQNDGYPFAVVNSGQTLTAWSYNGTFWATAGNTNKSWDPSVPGAAIQSNPSSLLTIGGDLYVGGAFIKVAGIRGANSIVRWDGSSWYNVGEPLNGAVLGLAARGKDIVAVGEFTNAGGNAAADNVAIWNGSKWLALGSGADDTVRTVIVNELDIWIGGDFSEVGGTPNTNYLAKWNGTAWTASGTVLNGAVYSLAGRGQEIIVGGDFTDGATDRDHIIRWDGTTWAGVGGGLSGRVSTIYADQDGIYAGGAFTNAGSNPSADYIARFDGANWQPVGSTMTSQIFAIAKVAGSLYAGGPFSNLGGFGFADSIVRLNGATWDPVGGGLDSTARGIIEFKGAPVAIGSFTATANSTQTVRYAATLKANQWVELGANMGSGSGYVYSVFNLGGGMYYVGGDFQSFAGVSGCNYICFWDTTAWVPLGNGLDNIVYAINTDGSNIVAGGIFTATFDSATPLDSVAKWDGFNWVTTSTGFPASTPVFALAFDGTSIFAGGDFVDAGGDPDADGIARYNGGIWTSLDNKGADAAVRTIAVNGSTLWVGGDFSPANIGGPYLSVYDTGAGWAGLPARPNGPVYAAATDGLDKVIITGAFSGVGATPDTAFIARYNGTSWESMGSNPLPFSASAIVIDQDNSVIIGGTFGSVNGLPGTKFAARWDRTSWHPIENGPEIEILSFARDIANNKIIAGTMSGVVELRDAAADYVHDFSLTTDTAGLPVMLVSKGSNQAVEFSRFSGGNWTDKAVLGSGAYQPVLSRHQSSSKLHGFWTAAGALDHATWSASSWSGVTNAIPSSADPSKVSCEAIAGLPGVVCMSYVGSQSPYDVRFDRFP